MPNVCLVLQRVVLQINNLNMEVQIKQKISQNNNKLNNKLEISGAEMVIRCLLKEGVDTVFGYPGGAIMPVYDALFNYLDQIHHVLGRHEQGSIHAAQGYARVS